MTDSPTLEQTFKSWGYVQDARDKSLFYKDLQDHITLYIECGNKEFIFLKRDNNTITNKERFSNLDTLKQYLHDYWSATFPNK
jgi:hypothetical protein